MTNPHNLLTFLYYWYKYYSIALSKKESAIEFIKHFTLMDFYLQFLLF